MTNRRYIFAATFILGFTAALLVYFAVWNNEFWFDEGTYTQLVRNIAERGIWGVQTAPGEFFDAALIAIGYPIIYPAIIAVRIFGFSVTAIHVVASLFTFGLVALFFFLSRALYGARMAAWGTLALATFTPLYGNGKSFAGEVPALFFLFGALLLLARLEQSERKSPWLALATGIAFGLTASAKPTFLVVLPALFVAFAWNFRYTAFTREGRRQTLWIVLGCVAAILWWGWTQFFSGETELLRIFAHYANPYYIADVPALIFANIKRFFTESTPAHMLVLLIIASAFFARKMRQKKHFTMTEITAFVFALWTVASYVRIIGWYRFFFPAQITLFLFLAPGIDDIFAYVPLSDVWRKRILAALMAVIIAVQSAPLLREMARVQNNLSETISVHLEALRDNPRVFFYNLPQIAARYASPDFYQYIRMSDTLIWGRENEKLLAQGEFSVIFVPRGSTPEIKRIPSCYAFQGDVGKIFMYRRDYAKQCQ